MGKQREDNALMWHAAAKAVAIATNEHGTAVENVVKDCEALGVQLHGVSDAGEKRDGDLGRDATAPRDSLAGNAGSNEAQGHADGGGKRDGGCYAFKTRGGNGSRGNYWRWNGWGACWRRR